MCVCVFAFIAFTCWMCFFHCKKANKCVCQQFTLVVRLKWWKAINNFANIFQQKKKEKNKRSLKIPTKTSSQSITFFFVCSRIRIGFTWIEIKLRLGDIFCISLVMPHTNAYFRLHSRNYQKWKRDPANAHLIVCLLFFFCWLLSCWDFNNNIYHSKQSGSFCVKYLFRASSLVACHDNFYMGGRGGFGHEQ